MVTLQIKFFLFKVFSTRKCEKILDFIKFSEYYIRNHCKGEKMPMRKVAKYVSRIFLIFLALLIYSKQTVQAKGIIEDGTYIIFNRCSPCKCMDVESESKEASANVHIWDNLQNSNQQWVVKAMKDGTYTIKAVHSGLYLDVAGANFKSGTNVQQYTGNNSEAQKWRISRGEDGYVTIKDYTDTYALDVQNGWDRNGMNIRLWEDNGSYAQQWKFVKVKQNQNFGNKVYKIVSKLDESKVLDVEGGQYAVEDSTNIQIWDFVKNENQKWLIKSKDGEITFVAYHSGKAIDVAGGKGDRGTNIQQYSANGTDAQLWKLAQTEDDGYYRIISKLSGRALDVANGKAKNGQNVRIWDCNSTDAQKWKMEPLHKISTSKPMTFKENFLQIEISNFSEEIGSEIRGAVLEKTGKGYINELKNIIDILDTNISTDAPTIPRKIIEELEKDSKGVLTKEWEQGDKNITLIMYKIQKYYNVCYVIQDKKETLMKFGCFVSGKTLY